MQQALVREAQAPPKQILISYYDLVEKGLWLQFCDIRGFNIFAVHEGKIKENKRFRLTPYEIRRLGLCKVVQK
jgi:hypothetical protein